MPPEEVERLCAELLSGDPAQRRQAAARLAQLGEQAQAAAGALAEAVSNDDETIQSCCASALESLGPPAKGQRERLIALLDSPRRDTRYWAATLLGRLGSDSQACDALAKRLASDTEETVRQQAAWALGQLGRAAEGARTALSAAAAGPNARLARLAKQALERLGH